MKPIATTVDLLRHGSCEGGDIFRGTTDVRLNDKGLAQMRKAVSVDHNWTRIVSSDLQRCRLFAESLAADLDLPMSVDPRLREISFGDWEGQRIEEVLQTVPDAWARFWRNPTRSAAPNGESIQELHERVVPVVNELIDQYQSEHLLIIAHGAVIRVIMCAWLHMPLESCNHLTVPYACMTRFRVYYLPKRQRTWAQLGFHHGA